MANPKTPRTSFEDWLSIAQSRSKHNGYVDTIGHVKCDWIFVRSNTPQTPYPSALSSKDSSFYNKLYKITIDFDSQKDSNSLPIIQSLSEDMVRNAITDINTYNSDKNVHIDYGKTISLTKNGKIDVIIDRHNWTIKISLSEPKKEYSKAVNSLEYKSGGPYTFTLQDMIDGYLGEKASYSIQKSLKILEPEIVEKKNEEGYDLSWSSLLSVEWVILEPVIEKGLKIANSKGWKFASSLVGIFIVRESWKEIDQTYKDGDLTEIDRKKEKILAGLGAVPVIGTPVTVGTELGRLLDNYTGIKEKIARATADFLGVDYVETPNQKKKREEDEKRRK